MTLLQTIILGIIEGLTEFLPISSTGHMMIAENLMKMPDTEFLRAFTVIIQLGAILAVVVFYFKRFFNFNNNTTKSTCCHNDKMTIATRSGLSGWYLYILMIVGCIPAAIIGLKFNKYIDILLSSTWIVVTTLFLGGILMIFVDNIFHNRAEHKIKLRQAFVIGLYQCIAMIPGVSRSMASIVGGMQQGLTRKQAAEFSFFLAVPTMFGATGLKLYKLIADPTQKEVLIKHWDFLLIGNAVAFVVALFAIKFFIEYITKHGFRVFGYYRVIISVVLGILMLMNIIPTTL